MAESVTGRPSSSSEPAADLSLAEGQTAEWLPLASGSPSAGPSGSAESAAEHTAARFRTLFEPVAREVSEVCKPTAAIALKNNSLHLDVPFDLKIAASGSVIAAKQFARMRDVGADGTYRQADAKPDQVDALARCYAREISRRLHFTPTREPGTLRVWVRMHEAGDVVLQNP